MLGQQQQISKHLSKTFDHPTKWKRLKTVMYRLCKRWMVWSEGTKFWTLELNLNFNLALTSAKTYDLDTFVLTPTAVFAIKFSNVLTFPQTKFLQAWAIAHG